MLDSVAKVFATGEKRQCRIVCLVAVIFILITIIFLVRMTVTLAHDLSKNDHFMSKIVEAVACRLEKDRLNRTVGAGEEGDALND